MLMERPFTTMSILKNGAKASLTKPVHARDMGHPRYKWVAMEID
jgi:hypothetical protein